MSSNQNESFLDVFKGDEGMKIIPSQSSQRVIKSDNTQSDDYFDRIFDDQFPLPDKKEVPVDANQHDNVETVDIAKLLEECVIRQCPICLKKTNFEQTTSVITHLKSCAAKNNISTEQMIKAVQLQQRQLTERLTLGLPISVIERASKRNGSRKTRMDPNLALGIALSTSLKESEILNKLQERETLVEAGIEPDILSQGKSLEDFGFGPAKCAEPTSTRGHRSKNLRNTVLFSRTQEERERIITEKVAMLLVDCDSGFVNNPDVESISEYTIKSVLLNQIRDENNTLWRKSHQMDENTNACYYVENLSAFISYCEVDFSTKLRHLSQIPCRLHSPEKEFNHNIEAKNAPYFPSPEMLFASHNLTKPPSKPSEPKKQPSSVSKLSEDWRYMLNKKILSDITVYAKNETPVYAHKLVLYVRCRSILSEAITETNGSGNSTQIVMWMEYSYEAILAFLEYIYTGILPGLKKLTESQRHELKQLSERYGFKELVGECESLEEIKLFPTATEDIASSTPLETEGEKNLQFLQMALEYDLVDERSATNSPELFDDKSCSGDNSNTTVDEVPSAGKPNEVICLGESDEEAKPTQTVRRSMEKRKSLSPLKIVKTKKSKLSSSPQRISISGAAKDDIEPEPYVSPVWDGFDDFNSMDFNVYESPIPNEQRSPERLTPLRKSSGARISTAAISSVIDRREANTEKASPEIICLDDDDEDQHKIEEHEPISPLAKNNTSCLSQRPAEPIDQEPYVSPVWDGFEDLNNMDYYNVYESPSPDRGRSPVPPSSLRSSFADKRVSNRLRRSFSNEPAFDSFSVDENLLNTIENKFAGKVSRNSTPNSVRKLQKRSKSDNDLTPKTACAVNGVTPLADYSNMKNTELKRELEKYGIKPGLGRNKAKVILRYIYDQLHPFEEEEEKSTGGISDQKSTNVHERNHNTDSDNSCYSDTSGVSVLEETCIEEYSDARDVQENSKSSKVDLNTGFKALLRKNKLLHQKILLYEPVWLETLKSSLKECGVKCSLNELMDFLDEKCITFRTEQQRGKRRKKKGGDQKSTNMRYSLSQM